MIIRTGKNYAWSTWLTQAPSVSLALHSLIYTANYHYRHDVSICKSMKERYENEDSPFGSKMENARQIGILMSQNQNREIEDIINCLQSTKACSKMPITESFVLMLLRKYGDDWKSALGLFRWAGMQDGYSHTTETYNKMVDILGKMRKIDSMWCLVEEMRKIGLVNLETIAKIMRRLAGAGRWEGALKTFDGLDSMGLRKDIDTTNILLDTLCKEGRVEVAREVFLQLKSHIQPNAYTFNIFVHGWCKVGRIDEAEWTLQEMTGYGLPPSVITYSTILQAYCNQRNITRVYEVLDRMSSEGCSPNIVAYTSVMHALARSGETRLILSLVETIKASGCKPDAIFYNSLINILGKAGSISEMCHIYDAEMRENGISPNLSTYNTLISVFCHNSLEEKATGILKDMKSSECMPDLLTYTPFIKLYFRTEWADKKLDNLLDEMVNKHHLGLDSSTYTLLIHGFCKNGNINRAVHLFEEMVSQGMIPLKRTCKLLLDEAEKDSSCELIDRVKILVQ